MVLKLKISLLLYELSSITQKENWNIIISHQSKETIPKASQEVVAAFWVIV